MTDRADIIAAKLEAFIRADVIPYEKDPRTGLAQATNWCRSCAPRRAIYDGPTEVHKWSLTKKIKRD
ncbi:hypothetical protein [Bradyrhizobium sp. RD5-C2]|uniref:hypothetical protein n=1 Tax=Bradyrhizobium sp. RD5-C2 TaxID=244562 RepID=UPI001CC75A04|nr:hypothetical protein [Bradyrhizobium sp. RD5-C2]GIQ75534.1 hypothetical protein BraRD5C2_39750 [Bradyrhizobium sp. RD5-C2]